MFCFCRSLFAIRWKFAIGNFISSLLKNKKIIIHGDGTPIRSYMYVSDLVIWLITILIKGKNCYPYNIGSEEEISIENLAKTIAGFSKKPFAVEIIQKKTDSYEIDSMFLQRKKRERN